MNKEGIVTRDHVDLSGAEPTTESGSGNAAPEIFGVAAPPRVIVLEGNPDRRSPPNSGPPASSDPGHGGAKESEVIAARPEHQSSAAASLSLKASSNAAKIPRSKSRASSLELRKVPDHILLGTIGDDTNTIDNNSFNETADTNSEEGGTERGPFWALLEMICLRSKFPVRTQMMLSFGLISALVLLLVTITGVALSFRVSNMSKLSWYKIIQESSREKAGSTSRYVVDALTPIIPIGTVDILQEAVRDRFVGYPDHPDYEEDLLVPFPDIESGTNKYPIDFPPLKLDWQLVPNVNSSSQDEHTQGRWAWYSNSSRLSMAGAFYSMQGTCDPSETNAGHINFYPNCTDANNNITTGGVIMPTTTNMQIYHKAKDLQIFLKPLYEYSNLIKTVGVYFANGGAGSSMVFPHLEINPTLSYTSIGCDWMESPNPLNRSQNIGTWEMIQRCHPKGEKVDRAESNPMETEWCRDQALNPHRTNQAGPFLDSSSSEEGQWELFLGKAVYDRLTKKFIGCTLIKINLDKVSNLLHKIPPYELSNVTLVAWDNDGTFIASSRQRNRTSEHQTLLDSGIDLGIPYEIFKKCKDSVDFNSKWEPKEAGDKYGVIGNISNGKVISCQPLPPLPDQYDPNYRPSTMVFVSIEDKVIFSSFNDLVGEVDKKVINLVIALVAIGFLGLAVVFVLILAMSHALTKPLQWVDNVSNQIINKFGDGALQEIDIVTESPKFRFSPKTELSAFVETFQKMILSFRNDGSVAKSVPLNAHLTETRNTFCLLDEFQDLYLSRRDSGFEYNRRDIPKGLSKGKVQSRTDSRGDTMENDDVDITLGMEGCIPCRQNFGPNIRHSDAQSELTKSVFTDRSVTGGNVLNSPLFWWLSGLIVTPLFLTAFAMSFVVLWHIHSSFITMANSMKGEHLEIEKVVMEMTSTLRAVQASAILENGIRNLHVLTRAMAWLMFGGVQKSSAFTEMVTASEDCKTSAKNECNYIKDAPCDCKWNHITTGNRCTNFNESIDTRYLQRLYWTGLSEDAWPNGDRNFTTFPNVSLSPNDTKFWDNVMMVPGAEKGVASRGYATTYDRLRNVAASSAVQFPLYNYDFGNEKTIGTYFGFEADGMLAGYAGCDHEYTSDYAFFRSTEENGAHSYSDLCPLGKFGFDSRCRGWYHLGKKAGESAGPPLYLSSPYVFAGTQTVGQSISASLIDPMNGEHIGQAGVDIIPNVLFRALLNETQISSGGFPILITPKLDVLDTDTIIGPNFTLGGPGKRIEDLVFSFLNCNIVGCLSSFNQTVVFEMRNGTKGTTNFTRTGKDGSNEMFYISYSPITVKSFRPMDSSDFSRGVEGFESLVYSLAIVQPEKSLLGPFLNVESEIKNQINIAIGVVALLVALASALLIYISYLVTVSMTVPIAHLCVLMKTVNRMYSEVDITLQREHMRSREVSAVFNACLMLFKVLRFANSSFFSGDIETAYLVYVDALRLFKSLDDKKAISVASNNLGNCMLAMYREMKAEDASQIHGLSKSQIISKGTAYFHDAIKLGEAAYDKFYEEEGWSGNCLVFMQQLSNRYFNRAIFLLTVKRDHAQSNEAQHLGFKDLEISNDMDVEVSDMCLEVGFTFDKAEHFDLKLSRVRGFLSLMEEGYTDKWTTKSIIDDMFEDLRVAVQDPSLSALFEFVTPAARMQQLDIELIRYAIVFHENEAAARVGIRILVEDEYVFQNAESHAVEALISYVQGCKKDSVPMGISQKTIDMLLEYQESITVGVEKDYSDEQSGNTEQKFDRLKLFATAESTKMMKRSSTISTASVRGDFTMEEF